MKKILIMLTCVFGGLIGCSSFWNAFLETEEGTNFDTYITKHGVPSSSYRLQTGEVAYSFHNNCSYGGQEEYVVVVYPNNIIKSITKTQYCPSAPTPPHKK